jgi:hypothetical protein
MTAATMLLSFLKLGRNDKRVGPANTGNRCLADLLFWSTERKEMHLNDDILNALDEEIARLRQARAVLASSGKLPPRKKATVTAVTVAHRPRRKLSAKARKAIADAQHKRWAKVKRAKKPAAARK